MTLVELRLKDGSTAHVNPECVLYVDEKRNALGRNAVRVWIASREYLQMYAGATI